MFRGEGRGKQPPPSEEGLRRSLLSSAFRTNARVLHSQRVTVRNIEGLKNARTAKERFLRVKERFLHTFLMHKVCGYKFTMCRGSGQNIFLGNVCHVEEETTG